MKTLYEKVEGLTHGVLDDLRTFCGIYTNMTRAVEFSFDWGRRRDRPVTCIACVAYASWGMNHTTPSWRAPF